MEFFNQTLYILYKAIKLQIRQKLCCVVDENVFANINGKAGKFFMYIFSNLYISNVFSIMIKLHTSTWIDKKHKSE